MNDSLKILYDEHEIIVNALDAAKQLGAMIGKDNMMYEKNALRLIHFFRDYADTFHHFKEEEILFPEMAKRNELLAGGVIQEMLDNHSGFREVLRTIEKSVEEKDFPRAQMELEQYAEDLLNHIAVENEEVFQIAESLFSETELENMKFRFDDCDRDLGEKKKQELADFAGSLRKQLFLAGEH